jgi:hypothetical protein
LGPTPPSSGEASSERGHRSRKASRPSVLVWNQRNTRRNRVGSSGADRTMDTSSPPASLFVAYRAAWSRRTRTR